MRIIIDYIFNLTEFKLDRSGHEKADRFHLCSVTDNKVVQVNWWAISTSGHTAESDDNTITSISMAIYTC